MTLLKYSILSYEEDISDRYCKYTISVNILTTIIVSINRDNTNTLVTCKQLKVPDVEDDEELSDIYILTLTLTQYQKVLKISA